MCHGLKTADKKYQYPIIAGPGQVVGMYELLFKQKSQFSYKVMRDPSEKNVNRDLMIDCFFLRHSNLQKILNQESESDDWKRLINMLKQLCLNNYIKQVYIPLMNHQQFFIYRENLQIFKEYDHNKTKTRMLRSLIPKRKESHYTRQNWKDKIIEKSKHNNII